MKSWFIPEEINILLYWMGERDRIRFKKEQGMPKPWTNDPILQDYRFCNVRRMDDKVSQWLLNEWYVEHGDLKTDLVAALIGRLINWPDALAEVSNGRPFHLDRLPVARSILSARFSRGDKTFTGAYIVPGDVGKMKVDSVMNRTDTIRLTNTRLLDNFENAHLWLSNFNGMGSFLAGQVAADLCHLKTGRQWKDRALWAPIGPGSMRGMNRLMGMPLTNRITQMSFEGFLQQLIEEIMPYAYTLFNDRDLHFMDIQNCLCEFDKYRRLTLSEGTVRAKYNGRS